MSDQTMREMTLDELVAALPRPADAVTPPHRATRELRALYDENAFFRMALEVISRTESYKGDGIPVSVRDFAAGIIKVAADQRGLHLVKSDEARA